MLLDSFYGKDLSVDVCDTLAISKISSKLLLNELDLFETKWIDYRHLHPTIATYLYAEHYVAGYRRAFSRYFDQARGEVAMPIANPQVKVEKELWKQMQEDRAEEKRLIESEKGNLTKEQYAAKKMELRQKIRQENDDFKESKRLRPPIDFMVVDETLSFWKGRQAADQLGIPYNYYVDFSICHLMEDKIWKRIPRPQHLYSSDVKESAMDAWASLLMEITVEPATIEFDNDTIAEQHKAHVAKWLCHCLSYRRRPEYGLNHYMINKSAVTEEIALQFFSSEIVERAKRL
jgi:hypothetical protein